MIFALIDVETGRIEARVVDDRAVDIAQRPTETADDVVTAVARSARRESVTRDPVRARLSGSRFSAVSVAGTIT